MTQASDAGKLLTLDLMPPKLTHHPPGGFVDALFPWD